MCSSSTKKDDVNNAILILENGIKIDVTAYGKTGIFFGYLCVVNGDFSISDLNNDGDEQRFFLTDNIVVNVDKNPDNHIVIIAKNFLYKKEDNIKNITLISKITPKKISYLLKTNCNNTKCALFFSKKLLKIENNILKNINKTLNLMPKLEQKNFLEKYVKINPYLIKQILNKNLNKIAVLNFNNYEPKLEIIKQYFNIYMLPCTETYEHINYLYKDNKINGVIIADFSCNTDFLNKEKKYEIIQLLQSNVPVLGIGNGAILIAECLGCKTKISNDDYKIDNYIIIDNNKHIFYTSNFCRKKIVNLSSNIKAMYYNTNYKNVVGFYEKHNNIGYTFSFTKENDNSSYFIEKFIKVIKNAKK